MDDPTTEQVKALLAANATRAATTVAILAQLRSFKGRSIIGVTGIGAAWAVVGPVIRAHLGV